MKRVRDEEEELQQQEQAAPMASSPTRNPRPAAGATPTGTVERPVMTWDDAVDFMLTVRDTFDSAKYYEFLYVLSLRFSIGVRRTVDRMKVVLRGHPDLKRRFNMFLPAQYELSLSDDNEEAPAADSLRAGRAAQRD